MSYQRNIAICIILSIVTCGIYGIYWFICLTDNINDESSRVGDTSGIGCFLLSIVTCGIYRLYWAYRQGEKLEEAKAVYGIPPTKNSGLIYLLLCLFELDIIAYALMQNELNKLAYYS